MSLRRVLFLLALVSPAFVALMGPYVPFQDWPGHLGVAGALIHRAEPAARIDAYYEVLGWFGPNRLLYALLRGLAWVLPLRWAAMGALGLVLGMLGPAVATLCRAVGARPRSVSAGSCARRSTSRGSTGSRWPAATQSSRKSRRACA